MNIKIAVAHHKPGFIFKNNIFIPIHAGKSLSKLELNIQGDDTGDNISVLNPYYCEMSVIYWLWKNEKHADYLGLCHYRRYFTFKQTNLLSKVFNEFCYLIAKLFSCFIKGIHYTKLEEFDIDEECCETMLNNFSYDLKKDIEKNNNVLYCTKEVKLSGKSIYMLLSSSVGFELIADLKNVIAHEYPEYYDILKYTLDHNSFHAFNMLILKREVFDKYCMFIFDILRRIQNNHIVLLSEIDKSHLRKLGFLAEILTDIFIKDLARKKYNVKEFSILFLCQPSKSVFIKILNTFGFYHASFNNIFKYGKKL
jgi:hypothetical protein